MTALTNHSTGIYSSFVARPQETSEPQPNLNGKRGLSAAQAAPADWAAKIARLQGPILVLGASGFVGANLLRMLLRHRPDVVGTSSRLPAWRLASPRAGAERSSPTARTLHGNSTTTWDVKPGVRRRDIRQDCFRSRSGEVTLDSC